MLSALRRTCAWTITAALCGSLLAGVADAQGGYTTDTFPELGLKLRRARDYVQIPVQPDEEWVVLYYGEQFGKARTKEQERLFKRLEPAELLVVWIDWIPDPPPDPNAPPPVTRTREDAERAEAELPPPPITTLERYVDQRLEGWSLVSGEAGRERDGYESRIHRLELESDKEPGPYDRVGWAYAYGNGRRTIAFLGFCDAMAFDDQEDTWVKMAESLRIEEPEAADLTKLARYYERRSFRNPEYRIDVRSKLVRGWDAEDLENYIVVDHVNDESLLRKIYRDLEAIRAEYVERFPPTREIDAISTVRVCKDKDEYLRYGGVPRSAGYWNSATEELVLYDGAEKERGKRPDDDDTFIVLYHEAFHQYIHYASGELPPHSWFNEGYGDYFSGARVRGGQVRRIGPNPWRLGTIQSAIQRGRAVSFEDIIRYEQKQYYQNAGICYAQGWSMVYFLNQAREVRRNEAWQRILPTYFDTLKATYAEELAQLDEEQLDDDGAVAAAGQLARDAAVTAAFEGVDLDELELAWRRFVNDLELD